MFCPKCGAGPIEGKFCPKCGARVAPASTPGGTTPSTPASGTPAQPNTTQSSTPSFTTNIPSSTNTPSSTTSDNLRRAGEGAKAAAAGIGSILSGAAAGATNKVGEAIGNARENHQKRVQNLVSGASFESSLGVGGTGGGLGVAGKINAARQNAVAVEDTQEVRQHFSYDIGRNRRYFDRASMKKPILCIIGGILLLIFSLQACSQGSSSNSSDYNSAVLITLTAIVLLAIGGIWLSYILNRPSDQEVDQMYANIEQRGKAEAAERSDLDETEREIVEPMVFSGPSSESIPAPAFSQLGKDGLTRWSNYQMSTVFCTEHQLYYYGVAQSLTAVRRETTTLDIYYSEIALVEIKRNLGGYGQVIIHTTSGDEFTLAYNSKQEESVLGLRSLLREKKAHVVVEVMGA